MNVIFKHFAILLSISTLAGLSACGSSAQVTRAGGSTADSENQTAASRSPASEAAKKKTTPVASPSTKTPGDTEGKDSVDVTGQGDMSKRKAIPADAIYLSPGKDLQSALSGLKTGGTLVLHDGSYAGKITIATNDITLMAEHDGKATIKVSGGLNMHLTGNKVTVQGLVFDGGSESGKNSAQNDYAANIVDQGSQDAVLQDCIFQNSKGVALSLDGDGIFATRLIARNNGAAGIGGTRAKNLLLSYSVMYHNNYTEQRSDGGGGKFTRTDGVVIDHVESYDNIGPGIWFDIWNINTTVKNSYVHNNKGTGKIDGKGIMYELSGGDKSGKTTGKGFITNNRVENNDEDGKDEQRGILISSTANVVVANNSLLNDTICLKDGDREIATDNITVKDNKLINTPIIFSGASKSCCSLDNNDENAPGATGTIGVAGAVAAQ